MKTRMILIAASVALVAGGLTFAGPGRHGCYGGRDGRAGHRLERIARQLDLTDGQRTRIREIFEQHRDDGMGAAAQGVRAARRDLRALIQNPAADDAAVRDAAAKATQADAELAVHRHRAFAEAFAVLTPEQQEKAKTLLENAPQHRGGI